MLGFTARTHVITLLIGRAAEDGWRRDVVNAAASSSAAFHFKPRIHARIGPVTVSSAVFGENTVDMWL